MTDHLIFICAVGVAISTLALYMTVVAILYKKDNATLRRQLSQNREARRVERLNYAESQAATRLTVQNLDAKVIKCSQTYNLSEPQYKSLTQEYLTLMSRQPLIKTVASYIKTDITEVSKDVYRYDSRLIIADETNV